MKRRLHQIRKLVDMNPKKKETRILYYKTHKEYKKLIEYKRRKHEEGIMNKLEGLYSHDRNAFWKYLKSIRGSTKNDELPKLDKLVDHFKKLYFNEKCEDNLNINCEQDEKINKEKFYSLNRDLTEEEVGKCIKQLKNNKAPGDDLITNEMIKCTNTEGIKLLTKLFNKILNSGYFPKEWN